MESTPLTAAESALVVLRNGIECAEVCRSGWTHRGACRCATWREVAETDLHVTLRLCDPRALLAERDALEAQLAEARGDRAGRCRRAQ